MDTSALHQLRGKKLLLLGGSSVSSAEICEYAQSQDVHVIVADNQLTNAAKAIANEKWLISTADVDNLTALAATTRVDGVFAGVSEFNIASAITISDRLGLHFYASQSQWELCRNKKEFKAFCRCHEVPTVNEYALDDTFDIRSLAEIRYPVVSKPADGSAADGVFVCETEQDLRKAFPLSRNASRCGSAIVEDYVDGREIVAYYTLRDGEMSLSSVADKYLCQEDPHATPLPGAYVYPSQYLRQYTESVDDRVRSMFSDMGLINGVLGIQGFYSGDQFVFFEMGYRLGGTTQYRYTKRLNGISNLEMVVNHSLTGKMLGYDLALDDPFFQKCCCTFSLLSHEGKVAEVVGLEQVNKMPGVFHIEKRYDVGEFVRRSESVRQVILRFNIIEDSREDINRTMAAIREVTNVIDTDGNSMLFSHI